ncbi:hypothetical protein BDV95DRAFT_610727 [Massariosphaeria phaeospora]|uniref:Uncharacterized protein n=1 Tax=Massariosphaeria phaeospora TaxID=100035 RepID=A0A7C8I4X8_9PLEO|nr:hypothetical protein BDV95DRAFT_610727 [Massariosphaeria phaeospora]
MAEPVSSIITIATLSLAIITKTAIFIKDARVIDSLVERLLSSLLDLRGLIKTIEKTCAKASSRDDHPSRFIRDSLTRCHQRLEQVHAMVENLASRKSTTFFQRVALKIQSDRSRSDIQQAIADIDRLVDQIHKGLTCWTLQLTSVMERRTSDALPVQQAAAARAYLQHIAEEDGTTPLSRSFSNADTEFEFEISPTQSISEATQHSRPSISSVSSRSAQLRSHRSDSLTEGSDPVNSKRDWVDFHYQIKVCEGNTVRIQAIKTALQQHPQSSSLANSKDEAERSPLHFAAQRGDVQLASTLLEFSANVNAKDSQNRSVLDLALEHNRADFVAFLLEQGVNETAISKHNHGRFDDIKEAMELRKSRARKERKQSVKSPRRTRTGTAT